MYFFLDVVDSCIAGLISAFSILLVLVLPSVLCSMELSNVSAGFIRFLLY